MYVSCIYFKYTSFLVHIHNFINASNMYISCESVMDTYI